MSKEILVRYDRCVGCRSCEMACAVAHSESRTLAGTAMAGEKPAKRIFVHQIRDKKIPINCRHCEEAPCVDACIAGAMRRKADGVVTNVGGDHECTGCWMCVMMCQYGIIRAVINERKAVKCDRECFEEQEDIPACVHACPTGALIYGSVDQFGMERQKEFLIKAIS